MAMSPDTRVPAGALRIVSKTALEIPSLAFQGVNARVFDEQDRQWMWDGEAYARPDLDGADTDVSGLETELHELGSAVESLFGNKLDKTGGSVTGVVFGVDSGASSGAALMTANDVRRLFNEMYDEAAGTTSPVVTTHPTIAVDGGGSAGRSSVIERTVAPVITGADSFKDEVFNAATGEAIESSAEFTAGTAAANEITEFTVDADGAHDGLVIAFRRFGYKSGAPTAVAISNSIAIQSSVPLINATPPGFVSGVSAPATTALQFGSGKYVTYAVPAITSPHLSPGIVIDTDVVSQSASGGDTQRFAAFGGDPGNGVPGWVIYGIESGDDTYMSVGVAVRLKGSTGMWNPTPVQVPKNSGKWFVGWRVDGQSYGWHCCKNGETATLRASGDFATYGASATGFDAGTLYIGKNSDLAGDADASLNRMANFFLTVGTTTQTSEATLLATGVPINTIKVEGLYVDLRLTTIGDTEPNLGSLGGTATHVGTGWTTGAALGVGTYTAVKSAAVVLSPGVYTRGGVTVEGGERQYRMRLADSPIGNWQASVNFTLPSDAVDGQRYDFEESFVAGGQSSTGVTEDAFIVSSASSGGGSGGVGSNVLGDIHEDPRIVYGVDGDKTPQDHPDYVGLQLKDSQPLSNYNDLSGNTLNHVAPAPTSIVWIGRELYNGKYHVTQRLHKDQGFFQGDTKRAELTGPDSGISQPLRFVDEKEKTYWVAQTVTPDTDMFDHGGVQYGGGAQMGISGLHGIQWGDILAGGQGSSGHSFGNRVYGDQIRWRIHGPGSGPSLIYDVRDTPLSTVVVGTDSAGGSHGTARHWILWTMEPGVSCHVVAKLRLSNQASGNPRTEIWRKIGAGPMVKVVDSTAINAFSRGWRYWKTGPYAWEQPNNAWWGSKNTRTLRIRSDLVMRAEEATGYPSLNENVLMDWLVR